LKIGTHWVIEDEGGPLVFRDTSKAGDDNRYAMFPARGNGKNL
jgi:hypothetical protein